MYTVIYEINGYQKVKKEFASKADAIANAKELRYTLQADIIDVLDNKKEIVWFWYK